MVRASAISAVTSVITQTRVQSGAKEKDGIARNKSEDDVLLTSSILYVSGVTSARQNPGHIDCNFSNIRNSRN
jgi:hypothetical protein